MPWLAALALAGAGLVVAAGGGPSDDSPEARVERLATQLRCPTCQGLSVADSPASTARAIRDDLARRVAGGESDGEIKQAYVDRYGEWILLRPRSTGVALLAWVLPVGVLLAGGAVLVLALRRWRREPPLSATPEDEAVVAEARADQRDEPEVEDA